MDAELCRCAVLAAMLRFGGETDADPILALPGRDKMILNR